MVTRNKLARTLGQAIIHLKERGYAVLLDSSGLNAGLLCDEIVEREGLEALPLYINCQIYAIKSGNIYNWRGCHE